MGIVPNGDYDGRLRDVDGSDLTRQVLETKSQLPRLLDTRRRLLGGNDLVPHRGPTEEQSATAGKSGALRAAVFGINDGLLSNTSLIMGFAGASQSRNVIVLAGVAGLLAGAFSMGAGEYVSMRVQREMLERLLHLEAHELFADPDGEMRELTDIYVEKKGLPRELAEQVSAEIMKDPKVALDTHARDELGVDPDEGLGSPWGAAVSSFLMFALGALIPLVPFFFRGGTPAVVAAAVLAGASIACVGGLTARLTGKDVAYSAARMLLIGAGAAVITFVIGKLLGVAVNA
jgi:VIT1/CCC1 family predicted Fe2+/Mn2+ transporter